MTSRERLMMVLNHKEADKVPHSIGSAGSHINLKLYAKLLDYFGIKGESITGTDTISQVARSSETFLQKLQCDVRIPSQVLKYEKPSEYWEDHESMYLKDNWGTVYRMPKISGHYFDLYKVPMEGRLDNENDVPYQFPALPVLAPNAAEQAGKIQEAGFPVVIPTPYGNGFLQTGPKVYGYEDWMMMLAMDDRRSSVFMETLLEMKIKIWDQIIETLGGLLDIAYEQDDLGTQEGPFVSPEMMRKKLKPYYKKLFDHIHSKSKAKVYFHSCGSVVKLIPDLIEAGVDILNPVQISAAGMDPAYLKKEFGKDLVFWGGGIDTQKILPYGTKQQIQDQVKRNIEIFGKDGGFVFCTVHNVQGDVPVENFITMWETLMEAGNY